MKMDRLSLRRVAIVLAVSANIIVTAMTWGWAQTTSPPHQDRPEDQRTVQEARPEGVHQEV